MQVNITKIYLTPWSNEKENVFFIAVTFAIFKDYESILKTIK